MLLTFVLGVPTFEASLVHFTLLTVDQHKMIEMVEFKVAFALGWVFTKISQDK